MALGRSSSTVLLRNTVGKRVNASSQCHHQFCYWAVSSNPGCKNSEGTWPEVPRQACGACDLGRHDTFPRSLPAAPVPTYFISSYRLQAVRGPGGHFVFQKWPWFRHRCQSQSACLVQNIGRNSWGSRPMVSGNTCSHFPLRLALGTARPA